MFKFCSDKNGHIISFKSVFVLDLNSSVILDIKVLERVIIFEFILEFNNSKLFLLLLIPSKLEFPLYIKLNPSCFNNSLCVKS